MDFTRPEDVRMLRDNGNDEGHAAAYLARACRVWRIFEAPGELHRWLSAGDLLRSEMPAEY